MKLYFSPGACSLAPHILLREANATFDLIKVDLRSKKTATGQDFTQINPKGYVPTLALDDGHILTEGAVIQQYIADQFPAAKLAPPAGSFERYQMQEWLGFISSEIHKTFSPLFSQNTPADYKNTIKQNLAGKFDFIEKQLAKTPFLMGENFYTPDAYLFTTVGWAQYVGIDLARWPALQKFMDRVKTRPAVQAALQAEG